MSVTQVTPAAASALEKKAALALNMPWIDSPSFPAMLEQSDLDPRTRELVQHFAEHGFVVIDLELEDRDALCARVREQLAPKYGGGGRLQDAFKYDEDVKRIALAPRVLEVLRVLYRREPIPFQTLNFPRGTEQPTHSDTIHFHSMPARFMCAAWFALEDVDDQCGPLHYYPGSHKLPILDYNDLAIGGGLPPQGPALRASFLDAPRPLRRPGALGAPFARLARWFRRKLRKPLEKAAGSPYPVDGSAADLYKQYEERVAQLMVESGLERRELSVKKGHALIWAANLFHGGSAIRDKSRSRHSQVTHYYFRDCMYYTPLTSVPHLGKYYMRKVRHLATGEVVPQFYNGIEIDTEEFND